MKRFLANVCIVVTLSGGGFLAGTALSTPAQAADCTGHAAGCAPKGDCDVLCKIGKAIGKLAVELFG